MEKPFLNDMNEFPDDTVLSRTLGEAKAAWDAFTGLIETHTPPITAEWRFYKDGYAWLFKVTQKKKTLCWVSAYPGKFKTTFYFPDRAEPLILESGLSQEMIDSFVNGKHYGKIRALTVVIEKPADLEATQTLIGIKEKIK